MHSECFGRCEMVTCLVWPQVTPYHRRTAVVHMARAAMATERDYAEYAAALSHPCSYCGARARERCRTKTGHLIPRMAQHSVRWEDARYGH